MQYDVVSGYLRAAEVAGELLAEPGVADWWAQPSALPHWSVAGLAGHLARAVFTVEVALGSPADDVSPTTDAVTYYAAAPEEDLNPDSEIARRIRDRGVESAGSIAPDLLARYSAGLDDVRGLLARTPESRPVTVFGRVLTLQEFLRTRTVELVVHADDLAVSVGCDEAAFPPSVFDDVIGILAAVAARRRGPHALVRALARSERAPAHVAAF